VIETTSSSSDSDHHKYDTIKLLNDKKALVRLSQVMKLKKHLNEYKDQELAQRDRNLIKGIFIRQPRKYKEDEEENVMPEVKKQPEIVI